MIEISVVVCTYNRAEWLSDCLETLCSQTLPASEYEIIVVDNNCRDHTPTVVDRFRDLHRNVRYCRELLQGLSHARNRGWKEAKGRYVAYFDDDSKAPPLWLQTAKEIIQANLPEIFGGPYYPCYDRPKPVWFLDKYNTLSHGPEPRPLQDQEYLSGTNFFIQRELLMEMGGFNPSLGMLGDKLGYGEETALTRAVRDKKVAASILYYPELQVHHLVAPHKMSLGWMAKQSFANGKSSFIMLNATSETSWWRFWVAAAKLIALSGALVVDLCLAFSFRNRKTYPLVRNYLVEHTLRIVRHIGISQQEIVESIRTN